MEEYLESLELYRGDIIKQEGRCQGCKMITQGVFPEKFSRFSYITFNNFNRCNLRCYYCAPDENNFRHRPEKTYNPVPTLENMKERGLLSDELRLDFGGGEPTLYEYFDDIVDFVVRNEFSCVVNTNAVLLSQTVFRCLEKKQFTVIVSPDAGSRSSYEKVKGVDAFPRVSQHVVEYGKRARSHQNMLLKYNITPFAATEDDLRGFTQLVGDAGIASVKISPELQAYFANDAEYRKTIPFATRLYEKLRKKGVAVQLPFWRENDKKLGVCT